MRRCVLPLLGLLAALIAITFGTPGRAAAQQTQQVSVCPVPVSAIPANGSLNVCVDRGPNSIYTEGETITIGVTANIPQIAIFPPPPPPTIRLRSIVNGVPRGVIFEDAFLVGQRTVTRTIVPPLGQETILAEAISPDGRVFLTDSVSFRSVEGRPQPLAAPTFLRATPLDSTSVRLDWVDNSAAEAGFQIFDGFTLIATALPNTTGFTITRLASNSYHCFRVAAIAGTLVSASTDWACMTTPPLAPPPPPRAVPPQAPSGLTATPLSNDAIRLTWADNAFIEDAYAVYNGSTLIATLGANSTAYIAAGLPPSDWNCFRVQAVNNGAASAMSDWACAFTMSAASLPATPRSLQATVLDGTTVRLDWLDTSDREDGFRIYNGGTEIATTGTNVTSYVAGGLAPGFYNCFRVQAFNEAGGSGFTDWACASAP